MTARVNLFTTAFELSVSNACIEPPPSSGIKSKLCCPIDTWNHCPSYHEYGPSYCTRSSNTNISSLLSPRSRPFICILSLLCLPLIFLFPNLSIRSAQHSAKSHPPSLHRNVAAQLRAHESVPSSHSHYSPKHLVEGHTEQNRTEQNKGHRQRG